MLAPRQERGRAVPLSNRLSRRGALRSQCWRRAAVKGRGYRKRSTEWEDTVREEEEL